MANGIAESANESSGAQGSGAARELSQVGPRLRAVRQARGWTLEDLATRAGMSVSTLSRLESGKRQASLELLLPLTRQLGIRIDDLVPHVSPDPRIRRPVIRRDGLVIAPLAPEGAPVHTYKITYPANVATPELRAHEGYEWLYILAGRLRLQLGDMDLVLTRGEAAEFDTRTPHAMSAVGGRGAQVLRCSGAQVPRCSGAQVLSIFNEAGVRHHTYTSTDA